MMEQTVVAHCTGMIGIVEKQELQILEEEEDDEEEKVQETRRTWGRSKSSQPEWGNVFPDLLIGGAPRLLIAWHSSLQSPDVQKANRRARMKNGSPDVRNRLTAATATCLRLQRCEVDTTGNIFLTDVVLQMSLHSFTVFDHP